ncbi:hypothetical protein JRQ81_019377, partial [Phrynocephalus forsythii]
DNRTPISLQMLCKLATVWSQTSSDHFEAVLFHAASLLAFFAVLRVSELIPHSKAGQSQTALLRIGLVEEQDRLMITICRSKTDPLGRGQ